VSPVQGAGSSQGGSSSQSSAIGGCSKLQALMNKLSEVEADNAQVRGWLETRGCGGGGGGRGDCQLHWECVVSKLREVEADNAQVCWCFRC
jgi:hypothetical protein